MNRRNIVVGSVISVAVAGAVVWLILFLKKK